MSKIINVTQLIKMLQKLPDNAVVWTAGEEGVFPCEIGNLFPIKVWRSTNDVLGVYIDDGWCSQEPLVDEWVSLDQYEGTNGHF